ncbi:MAG: MATE family efflux transporter [Actinobacteria bacterium]|nr:MATE family efflux transporter [Actinomycetota bacterium]
MNNKRSLLPSLDRFRTIIRIAVPIIGGMLSQNLLNFVDTAMIGNLGDPALAAVGVAGFLFFWASSIQYGLAEATQVLVARYFGAQDPQRQYQSLYNGLVGCTLLAIVISGLGWYLAPILFQVMSPDPMVQSLGVTYLRWMILGLVPFAINGCFRSYWNGINQPMRFTRILVVTHICNIFLNWLFIFGHWGMPALGVKGAALGSALSYGLGSVLYLLSAHAWGVLSQLRKDAKFELELLLTQIKLATPSATRQWWFTAGLLVFFWVAGQIGVQAAAITQVLIVLAFLVILPGVGFGVASLSLVSQALGRKDPQDAQRWAYEVALIAGLITIVVGGIASMYPYAILGLFIHDPETLEMAIIPFQLDCLTIWVEVIGLVILQSLIGVGRAFTVMKVSLLCQWLIFVPIGYILGVIYHVGITWVLMAWISHMMVATLIYIWLWVKRGPASI